MTFGDYQLAAKVTAVYPHVGQNLVYPALGLVGEAGEVAEKVKKIWRNKHVWFANESERDELVKELGDVLWYISALASELNFDLDAIASMNLRKLADRQKRDVLKSSGDNR